MLCRDGRTAYQPGGGSPSLVAAKLTHVVYVDPDSAFAYPTIQAAIDASAALALAGGVTVVVDAFRTYTEDLTIPAGFFELASTAFAQTNFGGYLAGGGAALVGNITWSAGGASELVFRNLRVSGDAAITVGPSQDEGATVRLICTDWDGSIINAGPGWCNFLAQGWKNFGATWQPHEVTGDIDMSPPSVGANSGGYFIAENYVFGGALKGFQPAFTGCVFRDTSSIENVHLAANAFISLVNCGVGTNGFALPLTSQAGVFADGTTMSSLVESGVALSGGAKLYRRDSNHRRIFNVTQNFAAQNFCSFTSSPPAGLYQARASMRVTTPGTLGAAIVRLLYTDEVGATSQDLFTLDITAPGRAGGAGVPFYSTGNIQIQVLGITTPGALAAQLDVDLTRL